MHDLITLPTLPLGIGISFLICAGYWELKTLMVPNKLTFGFILAALLLATAKSWVAPEVSGGLGAALIGMMVGGVLLLPPYRWFGLGAGCVKAQAAFGAWLGCALGAGLGVKVLVIATLSACTVLAANAFSHQRLPESDPGHGSQVVHGQLPLSIGALVGLAAATWM